VVNGIVIIVSLVLFVYWFRYTCLLILRDRAGRNYAGEFATANHLIFLRAKAILVDDGDLTAGGGRSVVRSRSAFQALDKLEQSLDRDYKVVTYLLHNADEYYWYQPVVRFLLTLDFHLMRMCYRLLRGISQRAAKHVLLEMAKIVAYLAQSAGERLTAR
jgi:hypothetical protein